MEIFRSTEEILSKPSSRGASSTKLSKPFAVAGSFTPAAKKAGGKKKSRRALGNISNGGLSASGGGAENGPSKKKAPKKRRALESVSGNVASSHQAGAQGKAKKSVKRAVAVAAKQRPPLTATAEPEVETCGRQAGPELAFDGGIDVNRLHRGLVALGSCPPRRQSSNKLLRPSFKVALDAEPAPEPLFVDGMGDMLSEDFISSVPAIFDGTDDDGGLSMPSMSQGFGDLEVLVNDDDLFVCR